ncbi:hypothetical protein DFJ73DRAFT_657219 [Zopfochytrium polystomum]|nr:hypothetical protein DFJ73DRAFT_657219 [Zopfochytrium polystomum]
MDVEDILAPGDAAGGAVACLRPCVARYGPSNQRLHMGETKLWCTCGLSKKQPWCDGSHVGTGFKPLKWTSSSAATGPPPPGFFSLCNCKYTKMPPFCDGEHIHLPLRYHEAIEACTEDHSAPALRLCTNCGYARPLPPSPTASRA